MSLFIEMTIEMVLKMVIALLLGALVGLEREWKKKPAGLRTHMIVSMGACLFTLVSVYSFSADPARIAAGIVTGIGFIGAGTIMASRLHVHGITTASTLWVVAAIGLGVGVGLYIPTVVSAVLVFLVLQLRRLEGAIVET